MEISDEDNLRLNVLLMQNLLALRIDESRMQIFALTDQGEAKIQLSRPSRDVLYLRKIRELISDHVMDLPGGYPVFLDRWTRSNQKRDENILQNLLLLGEPEAVVAVVHDPDISPELARRAWWAMQAGENARCLLSNPAIIKADIGKEIAAWLFEFLPFETEPQAIFNSVRLLLQDGLCEQTMQQQLWQWAQRKATFNIGFLQAMPDELPESQPAQQEFEQIQTDLEALLTKNDPRAALLIKVLSPEGQAFLHTIKLAMSKLADQETAMALFDLLGNYFSYFKIIDVKHHNSADACQYSEQLIHSDELSELTRLIPDQDEKILACLCLAQVEGSLLTSFFSHSRMVGSLMRRKMSPWTDPLLKHIEQLCS